MRSSTIPLCPPGDYTGWLQFSNTSTAQTLTREIQVTVVGCQWSVTPGSINRYYLDGSGDAVPPVVYTITNTGKHGLTYTVEEVVDQPWLTLDKAGGGPLNYQATDTVTASIDVTGLALGTYTCDLRFVNNCSPADEEILTVTLSVEEEASMAGLVAYYRFEDNARDWTGNGWHGIPSGTVTYEEGRFGRAVHFNGLTDFGQVDLGDVPVPATGSKDMTVAIWFRSEGREADSAWLIDKLTSAGGWKGWQIKVASVWYELDWEVPTITFTFCHDGMRDYLHRYDPNKQLGLPNLYDGNWHLIAMTIEDADGDGPGTNVNVRGYYDGYLMEGQNIWNTQEEIIAYELLNTPFTPAPEDVNVMISGNEDRVMGGVDEVSLWSRALSAAEIEDMYLGRFDLHPLPWPDADNDGDVDMDDFAVFQRCLTTSSIGIVDRETCKRFDRDGDEDIDHLDLDEFRNCATGSGIQLDPNNLPVGCEL